MNDALTFLLPPLVMCMLIASLHVYLGMHVLARGVIFVDLALAQLAALGATLATTLEVGHDPGEHNELATHAMAFAFTALGAGVLALASKARDHISEEAIVGIVYAVASSAMVLVLSRAPHGAEHIKTVLVGSLLLTTWDQVLEVFGAYILLGGAQLVLAKRFIALSWDTAEHPSARWDFLFYLLFGLVITVSVQVVGILLVFSFLIVPAVITRLFVAGFEPRLMGGWAVTLLASLLGLGASWTWDLPTGAAIVAAFGVLLVAASAVRYTQSR